MVFPDLTAQSAPMRPINYDYLTLMCWMCSNNEYMCLFSCVSYLCFYLLPPFIHLLLQSMMHMTSNLMHDWLPWFSRVHATVHSIVVYNIWLPSYRVMNISVGTFTAKVLFYYLLKKGTHSQKFGDTHWKKCIKGIKKEWCDPPVFAVQIYFRLSWENYFFLILFKSIMIYAC